MEKLAPDQRRQLRDYLILNGILDDALEARVLPVFANEVEHQMWFNDLPFEQAFAQVRQSPAYQQLEALQHQYRQVQAVRQRLKRDTVLHVAGLILLSALLFALHAGDAFVEFWADFGEGLGWAALCCLPFAIWRVAQTRQALREIEQTFFLQ